MKEPNWSNTHSDNVILNVTTSRGYETNGDHMRSLSDEELAHNILVWIISNCMVYDGDESALEDFILRYLKRPYDNT